jgi:hypothetical protein
MSGTSPNTTFTLLGISPLGPPDDIAWELQQADTSAPTNCASAAGSSAALSRWDVVNVRTLAEIP